MIAGSLSGDDVTQQGLAQVVNHQKPHTTYLIYLFVKESLNNSSTPDNIALDLEIAY